MAVIVEFIYDAADKQVRMDVVPRKGESIIIDDIGYLVDEVIWHPFHGNPFEGRIPLVRLYLERV